MATFSWSNGNELRIAIGKRLVARSDAFGKDERMAGMKQTGRSYEIMPRPADLGGGWKLTLFEDGQEAGGGVFPVPDEDQQNSIDRWNSLSVESREYWLMRADSATPAAARRAFLLADAFADAMATGEDWATQ